MLSRIDKKTWAFVFTYLSMFVLGMTDNIRGPLFSDLIHFFQLTNSQGSMTFAAASAAALFANMVSPSLFKKMNLANVLSLSILMMSVGSFLMGVSMQFSVYLLGAVLFGASKSAS